MIYEKMIYDKANVYCKKQIAVHITKKNNEWLNGFIIEIDSLFFILNEFKKGKVPVFFSEILNIETFTKVIK